MIICFTSEVLKNEDVKVVWDVKNKKWNFKHLDYSTWMTLFLQSFNPFSAGILWKINIKKKKNLNGYISKTWGNSELKPV